MTTEQKVGQMEFASHRLSEMKMKKKQTKLFGFFSLFETKLNFIDLQIENRRIGNDEKSINESFNAFGISPFENINYANYVNVLEMNFIKCWIDMEHFSALWHMHVMPADCECYERRKAQKSGIPKMSQWSWSYTLILNWFSWFRAPKTTFLQIIRSVINSNSRERHTSMLSQTQYNHKLLI